MKVVPFGVFYHHAMFGNFGTLELTFSYFTNWNQFDIWIIFGIFEKGLSGLFHRNTTAQIHLKSGRIHPAWPGPRPT
jgi:hypothetical protein